MPRPIINNRRSGGDEDIHDWPHCLVDAHDAYYTSARVVIAGSSLTVTDKARRVLAVYELDRPASFEEIDNTPTFPQSTVSAAVAVVDGSPLIVRPDGTCTCNRTHMTVKAPRIEAS